MTDVLSTLEKFDRALESPSPIDAIQREVLRRLCRLAGASSGTILRLDARRGVLILAEAVGLVRGDLSLVKFKVGEGVAGHVARTGRAACIDDVRRDRRFKRLPGEKTRIRSLLSVPMRARGGLLGVLTLTSPRVGAFSRDLMRLVGHVAGHVASEIDHHRLFELAVTDPLTGLYNRRYFRRRLQEEAAAARRHGTTFAVCLFDVDDFSSINARYGHAGGDRALATVANLLRTSLRGHDVAARYGGDEFVVLLSRASKSAAVRVADRVRGKLAGAATDDRGAAMPVTLSGGVAAYPRDSRRIDRLLKVADRALYRSKRAGKDRVTPA